MVATPAVTRAVAPLIHRVDRFLLDATGDRTCLTALATGLPVRLVTTTGARSGARRVHPLTPVEDGSRLALMASNFGRSRYPAWYHNLRARPVAVVRVAMRHLRFLARPASAAEEAHYWAIATELYPGYARYRQRAAPREIPVIILEPMGDEADG